MKNKHFNYINEAIGQQIMRIKRCIYLSMNGVLSEQQAQAGLIYHRNYGVQLVRLREIARQFQPDDRLSEVLWNMHERETMILSTMLQPIETVDQTLVDRRIADIQNAEMAEQLSFNLLRHLPFAAEIASKCLDGKGYWDKLTGLLLIPHVCHTIPTDEQTAFFNCLLPLLDHEQIALFQGAVNALMALGKTRNDFIAILPSPLTPLHPEREAVIRDLATYL